MTREQAAEARLRADAWIGPHHHSAIDFVHGGVLCTAEDCGLRLMARDVHLLLAQVDVLREALELYVPGPWRERND